MRAAAAAAAAAEGEQHQDKSLRTIYGITTNENSQAMNRQQTNKQTNKQNDMQRRGILRNSQAGNVRRGKNTKARHVVIQVTDQEVTESIAKSELRQSRGKKRRAEAKAYKVKMEELPKKVFNFLMNNVNENENVNVNKLVRYASDCPVFVFLFKEFMKRMSRYEAPGQQRRRPYRLFHPVPPGTLLVDQLTRLRRSNMTYEIATEAKSQLILIGSIPEDVVIGLDSFSSKFLPLNVVSDESDHNDDDDDDSIDDSVFYDLPSDQVIAVPEEGGAEGGADDSSGDAQVNPGWIASLWELWRKWTRTAGGKRDRNDGNTGSGGAESNKRQRTR